MRKSGTKRHVRSGRTTPRCMFMRRRGSTAAKRCIEEVIEEFPSRQNPDAPDNSNRLLEHISEIQRLNDTIEEHIKRRVATLEGELAREQQASFHSQRVAAVGILAAGVAHEINNPMAIVSTNLSAMATDVASLSSVWAQVSALRKAVETELAGLLESHGNGGAPTIVEPVKAAVLPDVDDGPLV